MRSYAMTPGCRRKFILNYFGDNGECNNGCDNCASSKFADNSPRDLTEPASLLLNTVSSLGNRYGAVVPIEVMLGKSNKKIVESRLNENPYYGKGKAYSMDWWKALFYMLLEKGYLLEQHKTGPPYSYTAYAVSAKGTNVITGKEKVNLLPSRAMLDYEAKNAAVSAAAAARTATREAYIAQKQQERAESTAKVLEKLRLLREQIANDRQIINPIYVLDDPTLEEISKYVYLLLFSIFKEPQISRLSA